MTNNPHPYDTGRTSSTQYIVQDDALQRSLMQRVFLWMSIGLSITGLSAYVAVYNGLAYTIATSTWLFWGLVIGTFLLVVGLSSMLHRISFLMASGAFALYSALNGLTLSYIFLVYTSESIVSTFFITAGMFAVMALYGYITKRDLTKMGSILFMMLIGLVIAGVVNMFVGSSTLSLITSAIGVLVFVGLTAYDVQKIKNMMATVSYEDEGVKKLAIIGALSLYLDFINLFLYLLRFLGNRK